MTTTEDDSNNSIGGLQNGGSLEVGYRWTCPYCGKSRTNASTDESGRENAIAALRAHIVASDGTDHGPQNEYPDKAEQLTLSHHVIRMESRR